MDDGDPHWPEGEEPGRGLGTVLHLRRLRHPDCGHPPDHGGPLSLSPCAAVTLVRGSMGRGGDVSLAAQRAILCQKSKMLGSVCFHILMPKDVLGSEPQEVSSEQHSSLPSLQGGVPVVCCQSRSPVFSLLLQCLDYGFKDLLGSLFGVFCTGI